MDSERTREERVLLHVLKARPNLATRNTYDKHIRRYLDWCRERRFPVLTEDPRVALDYITEQEQRGWSGSTVHGHLTALRAFYNSAVDLGYIGASPMAGLRGQSRQRSKYERPDLLTKVEMARLIESAMASPHTRDGALVCLLALQGLRGNEAARAVVEDMRSEDGIRVLYVQRRGTKQRLALARRTVEALDKHLDGRRTGPLVVNVSGRALNQSRMADLLTRVARDAGTRRVTARMLRHSMGAAALEAGVQLSAVTEALGLRDSQYLLRLSTAAVQRSPAERVENWLLAAGDVDLPHQIDRLLSEGFHPALAIAAAGALLEKEMRLVAERSVGPMDPESTIEHYKKVLAASGLLTKQEKKDVDAKAQLRNTAAHGRGFDSLTAEDAEAMVAWVRQFSERLRKAKPKAPPRAPRRGAA